MDFYRNFLEIVEHAGLLSLLELWGLFGICDLEKPDDKLPWFLLLALPPIFTYDEKRIVNDKTESGTKADKKGQ